MKKYLNKLTMFIMTFVLAFSALNLDASHIHAEAEDDTDEDMTIVYVQVPDEWKDPALWAWTDDGENAFEEWPGEKFIADADNEGWYYQWIPTETRNVIVNANQGEVQTEEDIVLEAKDAWLTVNAVDDIAISYEQETEGDIPEYVETYDLHVKAPAEWEEIKVLDSEEENELDKAEAADDEGVFTLKAPVTITSLVFSNGEDKTAPIDLDPAEVWLSIADDLALDFTYDDPNEPDVEDITVKAYVPEDWDGPAFWAWLDPDGANAFDAWPGQEFEEDGDWYVTTAPGWVNSVIVNANGGEVQTDDITVEPGKDLWIVVKAPDDYEVYYEEVDLSELTEEPTEEETEAEIEETEEEIEETEEGVETTEAQEEEQEESSNTGLYVVLGIIALAIIILIIYFSRKNNKN